MNAARRTKKFVLSPVANGLALLATCLHAFAAPSDLPTGGQISAGSATISTNGSAMTVATGSERTVMTWDTFNIGSSAQVTFSQPSANSAVLNRVTGTEASQLNGALNSNGSVFLVNPNGVVAGAGAQFSLPSLTINTSTNTPNDADFLNGLDAGFATPDGGGSDIVSEGFTATGDVTLASGGNIVMNGTIHADGHWTINGPENGTLNLMPPSVTPNAGGTVSISGSTSNEEPIANVVLLQPLPPLTAHLPTGQIITSTQPNIRPSIQAALTLAGQSMQTGSSAAPTISITPASAQTLANLGHLRAAAGGQVQVTPRGAMEVTASLVNTGGMINATRMTVSGNSISIGM